ncbi:DHS-like NAD/FAD-binding domain-containing protein [Syncephalis plumigaleata]|nr:DHS-like NAD/FAD-binding domain-containing protein [Syncephalis plumigaleata]
MAQAQAYHLGKVLNSREAITDLLFDFFKRHRGGITFLTGAGFSTESGIPDYRGRHGVYTRNPTYKPMYYQEFMRSSAARQRYWARSFFGYLPIRGAKPNSGHIALAQLQQQGWLRQHGITQNVDGLHLAAGTTGVIELHGALRDVSCTQCNHLIDRERMQLWLEELNPDWATAQRHLLVAEHLPSETNYGETWKMTPDGDVEIAAILGRLLHDNFRYPNCIHCGGIYKPNVVFFGESIPRHVHHATDAVIRDSTALLVMGTSMAVGSAMRILRVTKPREIVMINLGTTRADNWTDIRVEASCTDVLSWMKQRLLLP